MTRPFKLHNGGKCPVKPFTWVDVKLRDGTEYTDVRAGGLDWHYFGPGHYDIVGWRLSEPERRWRDHMRAFLWACWVAMGLLGIALAFLGYQA